MSLSTKLGEVPLLYQPGTKWVYSVSMDIQGYIVEKLSGKTLPEFYREEIFKPLGMKDAGFFVPEDKWSRFATVYYVEPNGGLSDHGPQTVNRRDFAHAAYDGFGRRRNGFDGGGLFPVCGDAGARWRTEWDAAAIAGEREVDERESSCGQVADGRVQHWSAEDATGIWIWV